MARSVKKKQKTVVRLPTRVGDEVLAIPMTFGKATEKNQQPQPLSGTVVYIHPQRRFYVVEFEFRPYRIREAFRFWQEAQE